MCPDAGSAGTTVQPGSCSGSQSGRGRDWTLRVRLPLSRHGLGPIITRWRRCLSHRGRRVGGLLPGMCIPLVKHHRRADDKQHGSSGYPGQPAPQGWTARDSIRLLLNRCLRRCGSRQAQDLATLHAIRQVLDHLPTLSLQKCILRKRGEHVLVRMRLRRLAPCKFPSQRIGLQLVHVFNSRGLHLLNVSNGVSCFKLAAILTLRSRMSSSNIISSQSRELRPASCRRFRTRFRSVAVRRSSLLLIVDSCTCNWRPMSASVR